jgi:hypothetical protein
MQQEQQPHAPMIVDIQEPEGEEPIREYGDCIPIQTLCPEILTLINMNENDSCSQEERDRLLERIIKTYDTGDESAKNKSFVYLK